MTRCRHCYSEAEEGKDTCTECVPIAVTCAYCGEGFFLERMEPSTCPRCHEEWIGVT